jgi:cytochrome c6
MKRVKSLAVAVLGAANLFMPSLASAANLANGNRIYQQHCANCHGPRGVSVNPGVPNFARNEGLRQSDMMLLQTVKTGRKGQPPFFGILPDQEILDALAFSRTLR